MKKGFTGDVVIGLEIHVQTSTETKLFCGCKTYGTDEPNTRVCPVCLGMPGSKPVLNKKAVEYALKLCLALKCSISPKLIFSRKSYFYPDMAKNYQISQYEIPLGTEGKLKLSKGTGTKSGTNSVSREIGITRVHMEEDPAAMVHPDGMQESSYVLVDYNRSGDPLVEVVTKPELESAEEARDFMNQLITVLKYLEIFDENRCVIKADANVSIKESGYIRAEVKNITGFKDIERALKYEIERQKKEVSEGKKLKQETRGWDSGKGITFSLREKETEADYGYIIDPDLVKIEITSEWIDMIKAIMPELADEKLSKFMEKHGVQEQIATVLSKDKALAEMFEKVSEAVNPDLASKWIWKELTRVLNFNKKKLSEVKLDASHMIELLKLVEEGKITENVAHKIIEKLVVKLFNVNEYVKKEGLLTISDSSEIEKLCSKVISENQKAVEDYKAGDAKSLNFLIGQVMRLTRGKAKPDEVNRIIKGLL